MAAELSLGRAYGAFRAWFLVAALYNFVWGSLVLLAPALILEQLGIGANELMPLWQVVGMMVLVFAPAYWWASRDPWSHRHLILIGTAGKVLGTVGFLWAAVSGQLPWSFGFVILSNDVIWLPVFGWFLFRVARQTGWRALLSGA